MSHPPILETRALTWADEAACGAFARALARLPAVANAHITLVGPLGAGKTTFVRHLLRGLGVQGRIKSPTYAVMEPHQLPDGRPVAHFDFYRFSDPREWEDAGFRELLAGPGLKLCEWPSHAAALLPLADLQLRLQVRADEAREVEAQAHGPRGLALLAALQEGAA